MNTSWTLIWTLLPNTSWVYRAWRCLDNRGRTVSQSKILQHQAKWQRRTKVLEWEQEAKLTVFKIEQSFQLVHMHACTHTHTYTHIHTYTHSLSHTHTNSLCHTQTHTHTHIFPSLSDTDHTTLQGGTRTDHLTAQTQAPALLNPQTGGHKLKITTDFISIPDFRVEFLRSAST